MATPVALLPRASIPPLIGWIDGYLSEGHQLAVKPTEYPIEDGSSLIDHAVVQPAKLTLRGWTSNTASGDSGMPRHERAAAAKTEIEHLIRRRQPIDVVSLLGTYRNMLIVEMNAPVDRHTGRALDVTLTLQELLVAGGTPGASTVTGPAVDRAGVPAVRGPAYPVAATPAETEQVQGGW